MHHDICGFQIFKALKEKLGVSLGIIVANARIQHLNLFAISGKFLLDKRGEHLVFRHAPTQRD